MQAVTRLAAILHLNGISSEQALDMSPSHWSVAAKEADIILPDYNARAQAVRQLQEWENNG